jgi:hypothetical protein
MMLPALLLIPLVALLRVLLGWHVATGSTWLIGCMPLSAVALCAGIYLPRRWSLIVPLGILLISDWIIDAHFGTAFFTGAMLVRYVLLAVIGVGGMFQRATPCGRRPLPVLLSAVLCATLFYVVSIVFTWLGSPDYAQSLTGLGRALTIGLPGYPPSYLFYRNALVSDLLYTILFMACVDSSLHGTKRASKSLPQTSVASLVDV